VTKLPDFDSGDEMANELRRLRNEVVETMGALDGRETPIATAIVAALEEHAGQSAERDAAGLLQFRDEHGAIIGSWVAAIVHAARRQQILLADLDADRRDET
jgi:hypothetical protein